MWKLQQAMEFWVCFHRKATSHVGELRWQLLELFADGLVPVGDRVLNITKCTSSILEGRVSLELGLTFYDDREHPKEKPRMNQVFIRKQDP